MSLFGYGYENKALPAPCCSVFGSLGPVELQALTILGLSPLCPLQAGAESREGEGCGTVGLLLEHSFEIGESSNVLTCLVPCEVRNSGLGATQCETLRSWECVSIPLGGGGEEGHRSSAFEYSLSCRADALFRKVSTAVPASEPTLIKCPVP